MSENPLATDLDLVLEHTRELWDKVRGERLFITGGTGFFGCWLLESFLWANRRLSLGSRAVVLTRDPAAFAKKAAHLANDPAVELLTGDIRSFDFPAGSFSHIIHAATETSGDVDGQMEAEALFCANVDGTRRVLEFADRAKPGKLLFTSSGAVYGRQPPEMTHVPEDYAGAPDTMQRDTAYGQSKRASEFLLAAKSPSTCEVKIARCFAFVGPGLPLNANYAIGNFIRDGLNGGPIIVKGDGTPRRSYLYAADLVTWLWTILFRGQSCRAYNVGSEEDLTIRELAQEVADLVCPGVRIDITREIAPDQPAQRYVPSVRRAMSELELRARVDLREAIRRTAESVRHRGAAGGVA